MHAAFYVSGHGFGHSTRAAALIAVLLEHGHAVSIVTNAPPIPFAAVLPPEESNGAAAGAPSTSRTYASYRFANVDPGISQPKAYDVDREATYANLKAFIDNRENQLEIEVAFLKENKVDCILNDSTFLACAAAARAGIPAIIVSNFTFETCYSYLSCAIPGMTSDPLAEDKIAPLARVALDDYASASLLIRLPGAIPIPSFEADYELPLGSLPSWVDFKAGSFSAEIVKNIARKPADIPIRPSPVAAATGGKQKLPKRIVDAGLIVRPPTSPATVFSDADRAGILNLLGVPEALHGSKVMLISFGGQAIPDPGEVAADGRKKELLPEGWIAIASGQVSSPGSRLPDNFFAPEKGFDVHVPDLMAVADVCIGKLGYGTCSEALSSSTPFIYVPRPLFIEEYGLKNLMSSHPRATLLSMSRDAFEAGDWAKYIAEIWEAGKEKKEGRRERGRKRGGQWYEEGVGGEAEGIAKIIEDYMKEWQAAP